MRRLNKISERYFFEKKIGSGSFGEVYLVCQIETNKNIAGKLENKRENSRLYDEYKIYKRLHRKGLTYGIPNYYDYIETPIYNILFIELLGDSLEKRYIDNNKRLSLGCILKIGLDILTIIENFHNAGYIHRDIKPSNFMFNVESNYMDDKLYIVDYGLSKRYILNNEHIEMRSGRSLTGTARYASLNVHMGIEPSRRDDIESIGYMLIYLIKGKLPWQGIKKDKIDINKKKDEMKLNKEKDQLELIGDVKMSTSMEELCKDIPPIFKDYINYARGLKFKEKPNYNYLKDLLLNYANDNNITIKYEFI